jgi:GNAT superfamily N-acetyltransferase
MIRNTRAESLPEQPHLIDYDRRYQLGFAALVNATHKEFGFEFDPVLDADLADPGAVYRNVWLLVDGDDVVGSVALRDDGDTAELKRMYLATPFRGRGLGSRLLETAITEAREAGFRSVRLDTTERQTDARRLFESRGFHCVSQAGGVLVYELAITKLRSSPVGTLKRYPAQEPG